MTNQGVLGTRLRACRIAANLSQEELAAQAGISVRTISDLERGKTRWPHPGSVHRLADALDLTGQAREEFISAASRRLPAISPANAAPARGGRVVPRQLPPAVPAFAGRVSELATLSRVLARPGGTAVITAIGGTAGVGKTTLALRWGHLVAAEFPDGQLYLNLNGFSPSGTPVSTADAIRALLEKLGVPADQLPYTDDGQLDLYRSLLVGKRMLIVLDNARDEAQVRPLLPGSLTCRVVVTSRNLLAGLAALDAAHPLLLNVLTEAEAWDLLEQRLGPERLHADDEATHQIIKACAYLPLALSIVAARAALRPDLPITAIAAELAMSQGLDAFTAGEPAADIRAVLSWSYRQLDEDAARLFRLAGLHPGPTLDRYAAAALADMALDQAERVLEALTDSGLMLHAGSGRYSLHDLLREYSRELGTRQISVPERRAVLIALFGYYVHTTHKASTLAVPAEAYPSPPKVAPPATPAPSFADDAAAWEWLGSELGNLTAISRYAAGNGWHSHAMDLSAAVYGYLLVSFRFAEAATIHEQALRAAELAGVDSAQGDALIRLATADFPQGRLADAAERCQRALSCFERAGDRTGQMRARHSLSDAYLSQGQLQQAAAGLRTVLAFYREIGNRPDLEMRALYSIADLCLWLGRYNQAIRYLRHSLALYQETGDERYMGHFLVKLGLADLRLGHYQQADAQLNEALATMRAARDRGGEADVLRLIAITSLRQDDHDQALTHIQQALALSRDIGDSYGEAQMLADLSRVYLRQGRHRAALRELNRALGLTHELQDPKVTASVLNGLGEALVTTGHPARGRDQHAEALRIAAAAGDRYETARSHAGIGAADDALGNHAEALRHLRLAHDAYAKMGVPEAENIRTLLDS
jgi:tetratricopeptide (TPR) repeat protein/transcriptional regulator with XRE-family HTH domain